MKHYFPRPKQILSSLFAFALLQFAGCRDASETGASAPENAAVDVSTLLSREQASRLLEDTLREPSLGGLSGKTIGSVTWRAENNGRSLHITVWPLSEWDELIRLNEGVPMELSGARAVTTEDKRIFADPENGHYFLQLLVIDTDGSVNQDLMIEAFHLTVNR